MEQKQKSFQKALKKGEIGEQIIREYLESKGWIAYFPFTKDKAHYFDMLATLGKGKIIALDVKTKARLNKIAGQGINTSHYEQYLEVVNKHNIPFYIVFIDDKTGDVHIADIKELQYKKPIYLQSGKIIVWLLSDMKLLFNIGKEKMKELSNLDQRSYEFRPK